MVQTLMSTAEPTNADIERVEAEGWTQWQMNTPAAFRAMHGIEVRRLGDGTCLMARANILALNRAIDFGFRAPLTESTLDQIIDAYRQAGARELDVQWAESCQPPEATTWLMARGFKVVSSWSKFSRVFEGQLPEMPRDAQLRVEEIGADCAEVFEQIVAPPLNVPDGMGVGIRSTIGLPGWRYYLVYDGNRPIAGACSFRLGDGAWFAGAATIEGDRKRGAHTALFLRRLADAAADGCRWATTETLPETPDRPNPSYRNMCRLGFVKRYDRQHWVLKLG